MIVKILEFFVGMYIVLKSLESDVDLLGVVSVDVEGRTGEKSAEKHPLLPSLTHGHTHIYIK